VARLRRAYNESHNKKNNVLDVLCDVVELPEATCVRDRMDAIVVVGVVSYPGGGLYWDLVLKLRLVVVDFRFGCCGLSASLCCLS